MMVYPILGAVLFMSALAVMANAVHIVKESEQMVIFRLGRYVHTVGSGLFFLLPFIDRGIRVDLSDREARLEGVTVVTTDGQRLEMDVNVTYRVVDAEASIMKVADLNSAFADLATSTARSVMESMDRQTIYSERKVVKETILSQLDDVAGSWGLLVHKVDIVDIRERSTLYRR